MFCVKDGDKNIEMNLLNDIVNRISLNILVVCVNFFFEFLGVDELLEILNMDKVIIGVMKGVSIG